MSIKDNYPIVSPSLNLDFANTKVLDSRITFSRPTSAVYYDGQTVTKAEENLLLYSQVLDSAYWLRYNTTIVANSVTAPDGTTTAETFTLTSTVGAVYRNIAVGGTQYTASCFFSSAGTALFPAIVVGNGPNPAVFAVFDLSGVAVSQTYTNGAGTTIASTSITSVGGNWYRCSITFTLSGTGIHNLKLEFAPTATGNTLNGSGDIGGNTSGQFYYVWGAQLEQRDTVTAYQPTTTQPITNYIPTLLTAPANSARFDHNPVTGESLGLLVEEQRTNLLTYSEDFADATWVIYNATATSNVIVAPDGTLTGDALVEDTATSSHGISGNSAVSSGATVTGTVYAKAKELTNVVINISDLIAKNYAVLFNLANGTVVGNFTALSANAPLSSSITSVGNGWYRCSVTVALDAGRTNSALTIFLNESGVVNTGFTYTGDGYSGIYIWGASLEQGSFSTSYIKTEASQVTRSADSASMTGANFSDWYRQGEGTIFVETLNAKGATPQFVSLENNVNRVIDIFASSGNIQFYNQYYSAQITIGTYAENSKTALSYANASFTGAVNGGSVVNNSSVLLVNPVDNIKIGRYGNVSSSFLNGTIKKISYYPQRLSNTNLQALTS